MLTLQKTFRYQGDSATELIRSLNVVFEVPVFDYFDAGREKDTRHVGRTIASTNEVRISQAIDAKDYRVDLGIDFSIGHNKSTLASVEKYYAEVLEGQGIEGLIIPVGVRYLTLTGALIGEQKLELIHYLKRDLQTLSDIVLASAAKLQASQRWAFIAINGRAYSDLLRQLAKADLTVDDVLLLEAISFLTDMRGDAPELQKLSSTQESSLIKLLKMESKDSAKGVIEIVSAAFPALYDFPLNVPEVKGLIIAGTLMISAPESETVSADDFKLYDLTAEYTLRGSNELQLLRYPLGNNAEIKDAAVSFKFPAAHLQSSVAAPVVVTVKEFDGSTSWSKGFQPDDTELSALEIEVDLQKPVTLDSGANVDVNDKAKKKLRGQVLEFSKKCSIKGLTVVIQAKADGDTLWRIVGAATTDSAGRFAIPYPYGIYTEAQAIVSAAPDDPATIGVTAVRDGDQTIADDFLYLLIKEFNCPEHGDDEDCHCGDANKSSRLPDQAELIGSKEYTQDLGGSCVNLSTPNRTLSEFDYQAIVRTSDPAVSNYVLRRVETGIDAIDANVAVLLANGARALETFTTATRATIAGYPPEVAHTVMVMYLSQAMNAAWPHVYAISQSLNSSSVTHTVLNATLHRIDAAAAFVTAIETDTRLPPAVDFLEKIDNLRSLVLAAIDAVGGSARYELSGGTSKRNRKPIDLDNLVAWQDDNEHLSLYQAVTVATGHILHYKSEFRADGYSMGDLIYSLPLAPGQKKEIVVFDSSHRLTGAESQVLSQGERLAAGIVDEREITSQLGGRIAESLRGSSSANTSGISAGFGTGGQGSGGTGAYGGSGSAVIGVAGGVANASSIAAQDSSRDISQFFQERLRQSIMQNADSYRQQNASVVTTVQEGQQYGVTSEVVANHNHCHALTMMYFEVLRHYAVFQRLSGVEECVFVPLLMTNFTTDNLYRWRDVLAQFLLPMPAETYLQSFAANRQHPLLRAFDANERIKTNYANIDYPTGSYDDEPIRYIRGAMQLRVSLPRPRTRFDRIMSLPVTTQTYTTKEIDPEATAVAALDYPRRMAEYAAKVGATAGLLALFERPPAPPGAQYSTTQHEILVREAIFDSFMSLDANYQTVRPADCIRITNFRPQATIVGPFGVVHTNASTALDFFAENDAERRQWTAYATILGYTDVLTMLNAYFKGNLISEWDTIFNNEIAPLIFERIVARIQLTEFATDFSSALKYKGGERSLRLNIAGSTSKKRNQLSDHLTMAINDTAIRSISDSITLYVESMSLAYSTAHYNGMLFSGSVNDDLLDGIDLYIPEKADEKRNPRKDDACLVYKLIEHLNSRLEYYNKTLWFNLDPDRRYMLLDGFSIQTYREDGRPIGMRSLASVVKNELITVTGNSLVFPVASGYKVSNAYIVPMTEEPSAASVTLFDHYQPLTPMEPYRISVPTRGVFAEAVQGACNACEKIETDRLQDWNRFPNIDEPPTIGTVTPPTPVVTDWRAAYKDFAAPIVNVQNAPAVPAPGAGLQGLSELLGKSGIFKDITGLDANQQNAIRTYLSNQENAKAFAEMAKEMAMQSHNTQNSGKIMDSIASAKQSGDISKEDAGKLVKDHLQQQIDGGESKKAEIDQTKQQMPSPLTKAVIDAASQGRTVTAQRTDEGAGSEEITIDSGTTEQVLAEAKGVPGVAQPNANSCWAAVATMMCMWRNPDEYQSIDDVMAAAGDQFVQLYNQGRGSGRRLPTADKEDLLRTLRMTSAPSGTNYPLQSYIDWMNTYGPLWVSIDSDSDPDHFSAHALVVIRIAGTGTPNGRGTNVTYIDPMGAQVVTVSFANFVASFEGLANVPSGVLPSIQIVRFADPAGDAGDGGGKPGGLAGAGAAIGGEVLDLAADIAGTYVKTMMAAGGGTLELPSNVTLMLNGTQDADYKPNGVPMVDSIRRCRITFVNVAGTGPGDGLDGALTLEWFSTRYFGPISSRSSGAMRAFFRGILFAKSITGRGTLDIGGALESGAVQVKLFSMGVEDKVAPPYMTVMVDITVNVKAKTASGDSIVSKLTLALHPDDPANFRIVYERSPHKALRVEVDTSP